MCLAFRLSTISTRFEGTAKIRLSPLRLNNVFPLKFTHGFCNHQSQGDFCRLDPTYVKVLLKRQSFWGFVFKKCKTKRPSFLQSNNVSENCSPRIYTKNLQREKLTRGCKKRSMKLYKRVNILMVSPLKCIDIRFRKNSPGMSAAQSFPRKYCLSLLLIQCNTTGWSSEQFLKLT